jgi:hypothetical protein
VQDALGLSATSTATVSVVQTLTQLSVTPASVTLATGAKQQFTATALDQFGIALASQPAFTWQVSGGGTISSSGLYTAPSKTGNYQVKVSAGGKTAQANVTVTKAGTPSPPAPDPAPPAPPSSPTDSANPSSSSAPGPLVAGPAGDPDDDTDSSATS